ncbi:hypothetical protein V2G26_012007 [Clonostachys chloroleuca]
MKSLADVDETDSQARQPFLMRVHILFSPKGVAPTGPPHNTVNFDLSGNSRASHSNAPFREASNGYPASSRNASMLINSPHGMMEHGGISG